MPHSDVLAHGYGDRRSGFHATLPLALLDGHLHTVKILNADTGKRLRNRSLTLEPLGQ